MAIRGSLSEAALPDVIQLVTLGGKTGCLGLVRGSEFGFIYFDQGRICHASVVNRTMPTAESVYYLFTWSDGTFSFEPGVVPPPTVARDSIDPQSLLLEGARRVDEWELIKKKIPNLELVLALDRQQLLKTRLELTEEQQSLLPLIDGRRDVAALIRDSHLGEFTVSKQLYALMSAGFVMPIGTASGAPGGGGGGGSSRQEQVEEHHKMGVAFYRAAMYDEALREFQRALDLKPGDAVAGFYLGLIALQRRDFAAAGHYFEWTGAAVPTAIAPRQNLAIALVRMGEIERAHEVMEDVLARGGRSEPAVLITAATIALMRGEASRADSDLSAARMLFAGSRPPAAWYHYAGLTAALRGDLGRARSILEEGTGQYPNAAPLLNNLAVVYERLGQHERALETTERGIEVNATLPQLHTNLGDLLLQTGMHVEAHAAYRRARQVASV